MDLRVIGAGLPRTGTTSLKAAIERLTGEPCYRMLEFFPRAEVHGDHLLVWQPSDGWGPLCEALGCPVPDEPFPRLNDSAEFRAQSGWD